MNEKRVAHALGWFSIGLGAAEVMAGRQLGRALGMDDQGDLLRIFGVREIATGVGILAQQRPITGVWARVAGDAMDLTALGAACTPDNPQRSNVVAALGAVAGITAVDLWCAWNLCTRTYLKTRRREEHASMRASRLRPQGAGF